MANVVYECAVNKQHAKKELPTAPTAPPTCCQKPMVKVQAPVAAATAQQKK